jgi:uncharacterized protein YfaS (alpha-2-macroglobulin family)
MPDTKKRRASLEKRKRTHFVRLCTLFVIGSVLASVVIAMNMDSAYLAGKNNAVVYIPDKMFTDADNSLFVIATDGHGNPLANQEVIIEVGDEEGTRTVFEGRTDEGGTVTPAFPLETDSEEALVYVKAGSERVVRKVVVDSTARIYLSTDKPVYQPGQMVHIRTLTFQGLRALASTEDVKIEIQAPDGTKIYGKTLEPNEYGIASLDYPLSDILPLGVYKIFARVGSESVQKSIMVKHYVLPRFKVTFEELRSWYTFSEPIGATVNCSYFFGKPVEGDITVVAKSYLGVWEPVHSSSGPLSGGEYSFIIPALRYSVGIPHNQNNGYLELNVTIRDTAGHMEQKSRMVAIAKQPLAISLLADSNVYNVESTYFAVVNYPDGQPVENAMVEYSAHPISRTVYTDERGVAEIGLVYLNQNNLYVRVTKDGYSTDITYQLSEPREIKVVPDKSHYEVFEKANFTVYYTGESFTKWTYYEVVSKGVVLSTGRFQLENGYGDFEITVDADMAPIASVRVYKSQKSLEVASDTAIVGVSSLKGLDVEISTDKDVYRPHEDAIIDFEVSYEGGPVTSALGVSIVDMSVFEISERFQGFEEVFMSLEEEFTKPAYQIKYYVFSDDRSYIPTDAPRQMNLSADEMPNMVSTWPLRLEQASQLESETFGNFLSILGGLLIVGYFGLIVIGMKFKTVAAFAMILMLILPVTVLLIHMSNAPRSGCLGGECSDGALAESTSFGFWTGLTPTTGSFANIPEDWTDIIESREDFQEGIAEPERVRVFFPETWYWNPTLITDEQGMASLTLTTPDSITAWGIEASASTKDAKFGIAGENMTVFQEFFVEPDIPVSAVQNDTFPLKIMIYNYLTEENNVTVRLYNDTWFELLDNDEKSVLVSANSVSSVSFRIKATEIGTHNVSVLAGNPRISDAVVREMRVVPKGLLVENVLSGRLDGTDSSTEDVLLSATGIPGTEVAYVKIQPGAESVVIDGAEKYIVFVSGCGEQSTSRLSVDVAAYKHMLQTGLTDEQMAKYESVVTQGIQHELMYLVDDPNGNGRAITWFSGPPDIWLTAWATFAFKDLEDIGFEVDERLLEDFHTYLVSEQNTDGSWVFPNVGHWSINSKLQNERLVATAYVTRALLYSGYSANEVAVTKALSYIEKNVNPTSSDSFTSALVAIALIDGGGSDTLKSAVVNRLVELKVDEDEKSSYWEYPGQYGWSTRATETTGYAAIALWKAGMASTAFNGITYLVTHRSEGYWGSTHDTAVAFQAIAEVGSFSENDLTVTVTADGIQVDSFYLTPDEDEYTYYVDLSEYVDDLHVNVQIETNGAGMVLYQVYYSQYVPWIYQDPPDEELFLEVTYDTTQIQVNDYLIAHLSMRYDGSLSLVRMILVDLRSPVGFSFVTSDLDALVSSGVISYYETAPRQTAPRQAKLYIEDVVKGQLIQFDYRLLANLPIKGTIQGINAFDMYDPSVSTTLEPVTVEST